MRRFGLCRTQHGYALRLMAIASTLVGGTAISGGKGGVGNTIIGVLIMVFLTNALAVLGISHLWQEAVFGVVIIFAALMESRRSRLPCCRCKFNRIKTLKSVFRSISISETK